MSEVPGGMPEWLVLIPLAVGSLGYRVGLRGLLYRFLLKVEWKRAWKFGGIITILCLIGDALFLSPIISPIAWRFSWDILSLMFAAIFVLIFRTFLETLLTIGIFKKKFFDHKIWLVVIILNILQISTFVMNFKGISTLIDIANFVFFWEYIFFVH